MTAAAAPQSPPRYFTRKSIPRLVWPLLALAVLLLYNFFFSPGFFRFQFRDNHIYGTLIDILDRAAPVMLVALGMTLVIATGGVDLSVGAVMAITGAIAAILINRETASLPLVLLAALAIAMLAGIWNGLLVAVFRIQPIVATLILMVAGRGIAQSLTGGHIITFTHPGLAFLGGGYLVSLPFALTLVTATALIVAALTRLTALGLFVEATGNNPRAADYSGVRVRAIQFFAYTLTGLSAGFAGLIATADIKAADANNVGLYLELDAILAVVIGGTALTGGRFSLLGSLIGALIIQTLTTTILMSDIKVEYTQIVKAAVVLVVCLLQSDVIRSQFARLRR